jgi:exodeoxyribonuclease VII small subunit
MEGKSYTQAFAELQAIVGQMEKAEIGIDELSEKVKQASELLQICTDALQKTEAEVNAIIEKMKT